MREWIPYHNYIHPPKFNSSPLKMDAWKTSLVSFWEGLGLFSWAKLLNFPGCIASLPRSLLRGQQPASPSFNPTDPDLQGAFRDQELATVQGCHRDNTTTAEGKMLHLWMLWFAIALWCWDNAAYGKNRVFVKHIARWGKHP